MRVVLLEMLRRPLLLLSCAILVSLAGTWLAARPVTAPAAPSPFTPTQDLITRGEYLALLGNCAGCHSDREHNNLAGGRALHTPFGTVYAGNLTPDGETGLGTWTTEDFWSAMHDGRSRDGRLLLPAFPYTSYTNMSRSDTDALFAYLQSLPAVRRTRPKHDLRLIFGTQPALAVWRTLFFTPGDTAKSAEAVTSALERGRYLVEGPGHCLECHAPRNSMGARSNSPVGGEMKTAGWWAPSLLPAKETTEQDLVELLRDGRNRHGTASGPMASVVMRSTQYWTDSDLRAAATYLLSLPRLRAGEVAEPATPDQFRMGKRLYEDKCADCHGLQGEGAPGANPPLANNPTLLQPSVQNLAQVLRHGSFGPVTRAHPRPFGMPPHTMSRDELAALITYIRQSWGNAAGAVSTSELFIVESFR